MRKAKRVFAVKVKGRLVDIDTFTHLIGKAGFECGLHLEMERVYPGRFDGRKSEWE